MDHSAYWRDYWRTRVGGLHRHNEEWFFKQRAQEIAPLLRGDSLLDYGCGSGDLLKHYGAPFKSIVGVDFSEAQLAAARQRIPGATFIHADERTLSDRLIGSFDCIVLSAVVQHLRPLQIGALLDVFKRHINPSGRVVLTDIIDPVLVWKWRFSSGPYRGAKSVAYAIYRALRGLPNEIGYAHSRQAIWLLAQEAGFKCEAVAATHYAYRFHAILS